MAGSLEAFVTLATNDTYAVGALVLGQSLRDVGTTRQLAIMITVGVSQSMRESLSQVFDLVKEVNVLDSEDVTNLGLLARPDLGITFTKLHCWRLTQYSKAVFMDADTLVIQNIDDLFEREEFSAAPDPGWPDCFNSGVFVFRPSEQTYTDLMQFALTAGSFDGGDQGLLNLYFHDWATKDISKHLPFVYNTVSQAFYSYLPAFKRFGKDVRVVHFIGAAKPWHQSYNPTTGEVTGSEPEHKAEFLQRWWKLFVDSVQPILSARGDTLSEEVLQTISSGSQVFVPPTPLLPYVPPDISPTYTPPPSSSSSSGTSKPETPQHQNTETRTSEPEPYHFEHRDSYTKLESFYAEPPMSNLESYQAPLDTVYMARDFEETWKPPTPPPVPLEENVNVQEEEEEEGKEQSAVKSEAAKKEEEGGGSPKTKETEPTSTPIPASTQDPSKSLQGQGQEKGQGDECSDISEVFASIRISAQGTVVSVPAAEPGTDNDPARQYAWEQGQIDYLGVDKFENIQKRLDKAMTEPPPPEPEKKPTSPFALPPSSSS